MTSKKKIPPGGEFVKKEPLLNNLALYEWMCKSCGEINRNYEGSSEYHCYKCGRRG